jgi:glycyl-tRNA synthetase
VVYDFESDNDGCVEIRERDSMLKVEFEPGNVRFPIDQLRGYFADKFTF